MKIMEYRLQKKRGKKKDTKGNSLENTKKIELFSS